VHGDDGRRRPVVLENSEARDTPSVVAFTKNGLSVLVGQAAKRQAVTKFAEHNLSIKRFMGRKFDEVHERTKACAL